MPADPPPALPGAVLFACNFNRVRSPMAESLMKLMYGTQVYVDSCGLRQDEEAEPDPFAVAVMEEVGRRHEPPPRRRPSTTWKRAPSTWWSR